MADFMGDMDCFHFHYGPIQWDLKWAQASPTSNHLTVNEAHISLTTRKQK